MRREDLTGTREILWSPSLKKPVREPGGEPQARRGPWSNGGSKQHEGGTGGRVNEPPGWMSRKSERPIVPMSPGNRTSRDPEEGEGAPGMEPVEGKMTRALNLARANESSMG